MCRRRPGNNRRGSIALIVLILLPVLFLAVVLGLHGIELRAVRTEMQNACDAASLAAGKALVDDAYLCCVDEKLKPVVDRAHDRAQALAARNLVLGQPFELLKNPTNNAKGDIVFGKFDVKSRTLTPIGASRDWCQVDAVAIVGRKTSERKNPAMLLKGPFLSRSPVDVQVLSVAYLDRGVIGFRPVHGTLIPLMPIALPEDPARPGEPLSRRIIGKGKGHDRDDDDEHESVTCENRRWRVRIGYQNGGACLLQLGATEPDDLLRQMMEGVSATDLQGFGGELVLGVNGVKAVPGACRLSRRGSLEGQLAAVAHALLGQVRYWPLYRGSDGERVLLDGFVAARIEAVSQDDKGLELLLRPTFASSPTVVVASTRPEWTGTARKNQYICKVRLAR